MNVQTSIEKLEAALAEADTTAGQITTLIQLSSLYRLTNTAKSIRAAEQALKLAGDCSDDNLYAKSLFCAAYAAYESREYRRSFELYECTVDIYRRNNDPLNAALTLRGKSFILCQLSRYEEALAAALEGWPVIEELGTRLMKGEHLIWISAVYVQIDEPNTAMEHLLRGIRIYEGEEGSDEKLSWAYAIASQCLRIQYEFGASLTAANQSLRIARNNRDMAAEAFTLSEMAMTLAHYSVETGRADYRRLAIVCSDRALRLASRFRPQGPDINKMYASAEVHLLLGNAEKAEAVLRAAIAEAESCDALHMLGRARSALGRLLRDRGEYNAAESMLLQGLEAARRAQIPRDEQEALKALSVLYEKLGKVTEALRCSNALLENMEVHSSAIRVKESVRLKQRFRFEHLRSQRNRHARRNRELQAELERQKQDNAATALRLVEKNSEMNRLHGRIQALLTDSADSDLCGRLRRLGAELQEHISGRKDWAVFESRFESLSKDYVRVLSGRYPGLSATDLRVCTLLRMQMSTKDIAQLLCVEPRSVEVYRSRIRRKLSLPRRTNLSVFLSAIT